MTLSCFTPPHETPALKALKVAILGPLAKGQDIESKSKDIEAVVELSKQ